MRQAELARYREDGFAIAPGLLDAEEVAAIRREAAAICRGERGEIRGLQPSTAEESDDTVVSRALAIHFPHKISPLARAAMTHPRIVERLTSIIGPNVKSMQSMLFVKHAGKPGQAWHQDENFIPTRDRSLNAAWIALDDATVENGCLWALPGSHRAGILWPDRVHGDARFDSVNEAFGFPYDRESGVPLPARAGDVVFFNGYLLHRSLANAARSGFRRALVFHYMSAESLLPWDLAGRIAPTQDNRDIVPICGSDPYAWKGIASHCFPFVRTDAGALAAGGQRRSAPRA